MSTEQRDQGDTVEETALPHRVVDSEGRGWWLMAGTTDYWTSNSARWTVSLDPMKYPALLAERGPLRPVVAGQRSDFDRMTEALVAAGRQAAASLCLAVYEVIGDSVAGRRPQYEIIAGRAGSWEAGDLYDRIGWAIAPDLKPSRGRPESVAEIAAVLRRWTQSDDSFVEVAGNLPTAFARAAERLGGWNHSTDQWLRSDDALFRYLVGGE